MSPQQRPFTDKTVESGGAEWAGEKLAFWGKLVLDSALRG
jgi:hypothetical protein